MPPIDPANRSSRLDDLSRLYREGRFLAALPIARELAVANGETDLERALVHEHLGNLTDAS